MRCIKVANFALALFILCAPAFGEDSPDQIWKNGEALFRQGKFSEATKVIESNPQFVTKYPELENLLGLTLLKLGKYEEARAHLLHVTETKPSQEEAWLNLGLAHESLGNVKLAVEAFTRYIAICKDKASVQRVSAHIRDVQKGIGSSSSTGADYFADATATNKLRWPKQRMPVKVYLRPSSTVPGYRPVFQEILKQALQSWTAASSGNVEFKLIDSEKDADIFVRWTNDTKDVASIAEGGDVKYKGNSKGLNHVDITILTLNPSPDQPLTDDLVAWISLHEVGHAIGLLGHSSNPKDVMFVSAPQVAEVPSLSERDKTTIVKLYTTEFGDTWMTLNDEAIECIDKGDIQTGVKKYREALKLSPDNRTVLSNLVRAEYKMAIALFNDNKKDDAEPHFKEALAIEDKIRDQNLASVVKSYVQYLRLLKRGSEADALEKKYGKP